MSGTRDEDQKQEVTIKVEIAKSTHTADAVADYYNKLHETLKNVVNDRGTLYRTIEEISNSLKKCIALGNSLDENLSNFIQLNSTITERANADLMSAVKDKNFRNDVSTYKKLADRLEIDSLELKNLKDKLPTYIESLQEASKASFLRQQDNEEAKVWLNIAIAKKQELDATDELIIKISNMLDTAKPDIAFYEAEISKYPLAEPKAAEPKAVEPKVVSPVSNPNIALPASKPPVARVNSNNNNQQAAAQRIVVRTEEVKLTLNQRPGYGSSLLFPPPQQQFLLGNQNQNQNANRRKGPGKTPGCCTIM